MRTDPVAIIAAVEAVALSVLGLLIIVTDMDTQVAGALVAVVAPVIALLTALMTRQRVSPSH